MGSARILPGMHAATGTPGNSLWTIGHSTRAWAEFVALLRESGIETIADVRRHAGSRRNPQFAPEAMAPALAEAGIRYWPLPALGGRRKAMPDSPNSAWRVEAFRGYADYMASTEYIHARDALMQTALHERTCVMCAEAVWWRCHRRLIADDFVARGWNVFDVLAPGKIEPHALNPDAVLVDGVLRYPGPQASLQL